MAPEIPPSITYGALSRIINGERVNKPTLMILSVKRSKPTKTYQKQASATVGDGDMYMAAIISPAMQEGLRSSSVVTLNKFLCYQAFNQKILFILDLKLYSDDKPPIPIPPVIKKKVEVEKPVHNYNDDDPPKLHRGTSFGAGSRESLFSTNSAQERDMVRELVAATNFYDNDEHFPHVMHKTRSDGFYRPVTRVQTEASFTSTNETENNSDEEESLTLLEKIRRTVSAGSGHYREITKKYSWSEKQNNKINKTENGQGQQEDQDQQNPQPPLVDDDDYHQHSNCDRQVVVMRQLNDGPKPFQRSVSRPWVMVKSLSFNKKTTIKHKKDENSITHASSSLSTSSTTTTTPNNNNNNNINNNSESTTKHKRTLRSIVGFGTHKEKKKPKAGLTRSLSAVFNRK